ncbi:MAG: MATE family efflux transporter [Bacteroidia bacterium]|nr:MAG: MATE family efflux transporter [Bacteroidia bacterium]
MNSLYQNIKKESWSIAWPVILAAFSNNLIGLTDTAFLSRISNEALGGGGLAVLWFYVITSLAMGWGTAIQIIVARALGQKDFHFAYNRFILFLLPSFAMGFLQFFLLYFSPIFLKAYFDNPIVYREFEQYLSIRSLDAFAMTFYFVFRGFYNGISNNKIIGYTAFLLFFINFLLNYVFVFGWGWIPALGSKGVAMASVISQMIVLFIFLANFCWILKLKIRLYFLWKELPIYLDALKTTLPISFQNLISIGSFFVFIKITEYLGTHYLSISEITKNIYIFLMIPTWGFGTAASTIISRTIGEGNFRLIVPIIKIIGYQNFKLSLFPILVLFIYPQAFYFLLTNDTKIIEDSVSIARIVAIALLIYSFAWIWVSAVIGTGATIVAFLIEGITLLVYLSYIIICYYYTQDLYLIWLCEIIYMVIMVSMSYFYIKSNHWQKIRFNLNHHSENYEQSTNC